MLIGHIVAATALQASAPSIDAFARLPAFMGAQLSEDGEAVAYPCPSAARQMVCVQPVAPGAQPTSVPAPAGVRLTDFYFANDRHLVIRTSQTDRVNTSEGPRTYEVDRAVVYDIRSGESAILMSDELSSTSNANVVSLDRSDPGSVLVEMTFVRGSNTATGSNIRSEASFESELYRADLISGRSRSIARGDELYRLVDADGRIRARVFHDIARGDFQIRAGERGQTVLYERRHGYERPRLSGFVDETGAAFDTVTDLGRGVLRLDLETGEITDPFGFADLGYQAPLFDRYNMLWGFVGRRDGQLVQRIVDADLRRDQEALSAAMGTNVWIETFTNARDSVIFTVREAGTPPVFYLYDRPAGQVAILGEAYPELLEADLPQRRMIEYRASDGLLIPAVLTYPPDFEEGQTAPLVVMPHGGPAARDGLEFDWWAQGVAARGYLVLQPNFRGSDGYGPAFREAGFGEFGGLMIEDILDGARELQRRGLVQGDRFCLTGGSYGGYAALMGAARAPGEVACVVAFAPVTSPVAILAESNREGSETTEQFWEEYMGSRFQDQGSIDAMTPLAQGARLTMPVLVLHGADDRVVPVDQSRRLEQVMRSSAAFAYVELENESYYLHLPGSRRLLLERSLELFDQTLRSPPAD